MGDQPQRLTGAGADEPHLTDAAVGVERRRTGVPEIEPNMGPGGGVCVTNAWYW